MSTTYSLVCDECKEMYWCGQDDYIYSENKTVKFLHDHCGHKIMTWLMMTLLTITRMLNKHENLKI